MILVRIEIAPHGLMNNVQLIADLTITNDGKEVGQFAAYDVTLQTAGSRKWHGRVAGFDRSLGAVALVTAALNAIGASTYPVHAVRPRDETESQSRAPQAIPRDHSAL